MKRNSIVFGFVNSCVGIAFKGTPQQETGDNQSGSCFAVGATSAGEMVAARGIIVGEHSGHKSGQALETNGEKHECRDCR
jgi:hypothetical protein